MNKKAQRGIKFRADHANPNRIDDSVKAELARALAEFGDLSGVIVNRRPAFGKAAVDIIRAAAKRLYVKVDLRPHFPAGYLRPEECDVDALTLPDRPAERGLIA